MDIRRKAVSLREAADEKFSVRARIKTGSRGDLSVLVDGKPVFGYKREGAIPPIPELLQRIAAAQSAAG